MKLTSTLSLFFVVIVSGGYNGGNKRVDQFNIDGYAKFEKIPSNVRLSTIVNNPSSSSYRRGKSLDSVNCDGAITAVPRGLTFITRYNFYRKYLHAYGLPVISSARVSDKALRRACHIIKFLFADRKDVRDSMYRNFGRFGVIAINEGTTTIPEFSHLPNWWNTRARGLGGVLGRPISTGGEENLLCLRTDRYYGDDIFFHEASHGVAEVAIKGGGIPGFYNRLLRAFNSAKRSGKWRNTYAMTDSREYFAEGMQSFFENHPESARPNGVHNHVNTRAELKAYDPALYNLIKEAYPCMNRYKMCTNNQPNFRMNCDKSSTLPPPVPRTTLSPPQPTKCITVWEDAPKAANTRCYDYNTYCKYWARTGECTKRAHYMSRQCCKSCRANQQSATCIDNNRQCNNWQRRGECNRNPRYMKVYCKKSCGVCTTKKKVKKCWVVTTIAPKTTEAPPPIETTTQIPPPIETTTEVPPPIETTTEVPPPVITTTEVPPPVITTTEVPPPGETTTKKPPPVITTQVPPPGETTTKMPPPVITTEVPPPIPDKCEVTVAAGLESGRIPDGAMKASSSESKWHAAGQGRLNLKASDKGVGAWCAGKQDTNQYLEVDLGFLKTVKEMAIQGRDSSTPKFVRSFTIKFSDDRVNWYVYAQADNIEKARIFNGNTDTTSVNRLKFDFPIVAQYIRVIPEEWTEMICMRVEFYFCK